MKLLEKFETVARQRRLADNTIDAYRSWIQQFLRFSATTRGQWTRPEELGTAAVEAFLNDLVTRRRLSASSQNQALDALVFLYSQVLDAIPANHLGKFALLRSSRPKRVPTVLSAAEVRRVIEAIPKEHISRLLTELMYGTGMRVGEVCTLRLRDIDVDRAQIIVRSPKGDTFRHSVATHVTEAGYDVRQVQRLPGDAMLATTSKPSHCAGRRAATFRGEGPPLRS